MKKIMFILMLSVAVNAAVYRVIGNGGRGFTTTQNGSAGNEFRGCYGFQKAMKGVVAGDTILIYAPIDNYIYLDRMITLTLGSDVTATWVVGDSVQNNTGSGDDWTAVLCSLSTTTAIVELRTGSNANVAIADGIQNVTRSENTTVSAKACSGIIHYVTGTSSAYIHIFGARSDFTSDDSSYAYIYGNNSCDYGFSATAINYVHCKNLYLKRFTVGAWRSVTTNCDKWKFTQCVGDSSGYGMEATRFTNSQIKRCQFSYNTGIGITSYTGSIQKSKILSNGSDGIRSTGISAIIGNIIAKNGGHNINFSSSTSANSSCVGNVIHGAVSNGLNFGNASAGAYIIRENRITGNGGFGIAHTSSNNTNLIEDNYFQGNTSGDFNTNITSYSNNLTGSDTDYGYVNSSTDNYVLSSSATGRNIPIKVGF